MAAVVRTRRERRAEDRIEDGFKSITPHTDREHVTGRMGVEDTMPACCFEERSRAAETYFGGSWEKPVRS
jgi:hypothetical protein